MSTPAVFFLATVITLSPHIGDKGARWLGTFMGLLCIASSLGWIK